MNHVAIATFRTVPPEAEPAIPRREAAFAWAAADYPSSDNSTALRKLQSAAARGDANAQYNLGWLYFDGEGVPQDDVEAYAWFSVAAAQGYAEITGERNILAKILAPADLLRAQARSREYCKLYG